MRLWSVSLGQCPLSGSIQIECIYFVPLNSFRLHFRVYPDHAQPVKDENAEATSTTKGILEDPENGGYVMHIETYLPLDDAPPAPLLGK